MGGPGPAWSLPSGPECVPSPGCPSDGIPYWSLPQPGAPWPEQCWVTSFQAGMRFLHWHFLSTQWGQLPGSRLPAVPSSRGATCLLQWLEGSLSLKGEGAGRSWGHLPGWRNWALGEGPAGRAAPQELARQWTPESAGGGGAGLGQLFSWEWGGAPEGEAGCRRAGEEPGVKQAREGLEPSVTPSGDVAGYLY